MKRSGSTDPRIHEVAELQLEKLIADLNRQLALYWSASGAQQQIGKLYVSGGCAVGEWHAG